MSELHKMHELHSIYGLEKRGAAEATPPCYDSPLAGKLSQYFLPPGNGATFTA